MTLTTERQQFAEQNEMSMEFVNWFFDEKKDGCGNAWFIMAAAMWEGWKGRDDREAQPVMWAHERKLSTDVAITKDAAVAAAWESEGLSVTPLYTAPPAPAVPDDYQHLKNVQELYHSQEERLFSLAQRIKGVSFDKYSHTTAQAIDVLERAILGDDGNACRAAMLESVAATSSIPMISDSYKLPEGWVACSERMPELDKRVLLYFGSYDGHIEDGCIGDDGDGPYHYFFDGDSLQQEPTHWMPLPAAPEGGNG